MRSLVLKYVNKYDFLSAEFCILLALCLPVVVACIDVMAVSVGLNNIISDLSITLNQAQWLLSGYTIGTAAFLIIIGKLADIYGRRKLLLLGIMGFTFSSLIASVSSSIVILIGCRFFQGVASAMMMTTVISIITHYYSPTERALILSKWGFSLGLGMAIGPLVGGIIISLFNWRIIFLINLPIGILSYYLVKHFVPESKDEHTRFKINWFESVLLSSVLILLLTILSQGNLWGWSSSLIITLTVCFIGLLISLIFLETKKENPIVDLSLFNYAKFNYATCCGAIAYFCMYAWLFIFSVYLQNVFGMSPLKSGILSASFSIAFAISAKKIGIFIQKIGCNKLMKYGFSFKKLYPANR